MCFFDFHIAAGVTVGAAQSENHVQLGSHALRDCLNV